MNLGFNAVAGHGALLMPIYLPSKHILNFAYKKKSLPHDSMYFISGLKGVRHKAKTKETEKYRNFY